MKKFIFSLQTLLDLSLAREKQQKIQLSQADMALAALEQGLLALTAAFAQARDRYTDQTTRGVSAPALGQYGHYFDDTRATIRQQQEKIRITRLERDRVMQALVETRKEIKTYEKLRESQYQQYLLGQKIEDEKVMGDLVSFRAAVT